jgi:tRNA(adenine34) deaminase
MTFNGNLPMLLKPKTDEDYMRMALAQAQKAAAIGEVPVGAVVVIDDQVVARAYNQVEMLNDATAHAEMIALTQAASAIRNWRLTPAVLYVTKEPCPMCAGAMVNCRLGRVVFGCPDPKGGAAGSALCLTNFPGLLHEVAVTGQVLEFECRELIQEFFRNRRQEQKNTKQADLPHG